MALHRDIFCVGRQWTVTGLGIQAVDQRLKGAFDIEVCRLWEEGSIERIRAPAWLNQDISPRRLRSRDHAIPNRRAARPTLVESALELIQPKLAEPAKCRGTVAEADSARGEPAAGAEPLLDVPQALAMQLERASARFVPLWRVRG